MENEGFVHIFSYSEAPLEPMVSTEHYVFEEAGADITT